MSTTNPLVRIGRVLTGVGLGCNIGLAGRALRGGAGVALLAGAVAAAAGRPILGVGLGAASVLGAAYLLWEAATGYCPAVHLAEAASDGD